MAKDERLKTKDKRLKINEKRLMMKGKRLMMKDERGKMKVINRILFFCLLSIIFVSCSVNKETTSLRRLSANHVIREVENNSFEFDDIEAKFDAKIKGDNKIGLKGQLRMHNDSVIWISVSMKLGIEVARVMITEDSIKFINKTNRTYLAESLDNAKKIFPVDASINLIQDILVGNDSRLNRRNRYKVEIENDRYKLTSGRNDIIAKDIWITLETFKIDQYEINLFNDNTIKVKYDNFQRYNEKLLPTKIIFELNSGSHINLEIDYTEIEIGEELKFPFNISKKYSKIK